MQDQHDYIWLSGQQGLTRFDGSHVINFKKHDKNWPLSFTWTHDISNANNKILVATEGHHLLLVDPKTGEESPLAMSNKDSTIYSAVYFKQHYYYYSADADNLYRYEPISKQTFLLKEQLTLLAFLPLKSTLYFSTNKHIYRIDNDNISTVFSGSIIASASTNNALIYATSENGVHKLYHFSAQGHQQAIETDSPVRAIAKENNTNNFYTVNASGEINKFSQQLIELPHHYPLSKKPRPRKIFNDSSNALWLIGSGGVEILTNSQNSNYPHVFNTDINGIEIAKVNGKLLLGSYGQGLDNFNMPTSEAIKAINSQFSTKGKKITDMLTIGADIYITTFDGLWRYQVIKNTLEKISLTSKSKVLLKLTQKNNNLYIATDGDGFIIYDINKQRQILHIDRTMAFSSAEIIDILPISPDKLWLATAKGIDIYDIPSHNIKQLDTNSSAKVISLTSINHKIYAATKGDGILIFTLKEVLLNRIGIGIDFGYIRAISDRILAPSRRGLYRINPNTDQITLVPATDMYSFTSEPIKLRNKAYIAHYGGVLEIPLITPKQFHPKVHISKTTISGKSSIANKIIKVSSSNDVITLSFASLDYRSGQEKQFKYQINENKWQNVNGNQLTLTGLTAGEYRIVIKGTNSLGQWSQYQAYADIMVAYPWYWTPQLRIIYSVLALSFILLTAWLLYLRGRSINLVHHILSKDIKNRGQAAVKVQRQLNQAIKLLDDIPTEKFHQHDIKIKSLLTSSIKEINSANRTKEPNNIFGERLSVALPYLCNFLQQTYQVTIRHKLAINEKNISDEIQGALYKIIYEALSSAIYNGNSQSFVVIIKEYQHKLWLSVSDDNSSFTNFNNRINFDMAMYYIRQVAKKHNATIHTFDEQEKGSQLAVSMPLGKIPLDTDENTAQH